MHIFEPRYRHLVRDLVAPEAEGPREFGVVGIRQGWEVGTDGVKAMYAVGCTAELRQVQPYDDGRFDIVTVGRRRFRLHSMDTATRPYLSGDVEWLPDDVGNPDEADVLARGVGELFARCRRMLRAFQTPKSALPTKEPPEEDPDDELAAPGIGDPRVLSYLVAATAPLTLDDRQSLLALDDVVSRLRRELRLLKREVTMLSRLRAVPVPLAELRVPMGPN